ncbi:MAG: hypothetical protein ACHQ5A_15480 [Opitutales bacterium]
MPLRRVEPRQAGPTALGILLPPGTPTVLILRPRAVPWDLLLVRGGAGDETGTPFLHLDPNEGQAIAEGVLRALERWAAGGPGNVEAAYAADGVGFWVQAQVGSFALLACERRPGEAYRPAAFTTQTEAETAAQRLADALSPGDGAELQVYLNTRHFGR